MYSYSWDEETGGLLLNSSTLQFSKEPRPVYYKELDILGFDKYWNYDKDDSVPLMWAEANNYIYRGRHVATVKGGSFFSNPQIEIIESPEKDGGKIVPIDIKGMIQKNKKILDALVKDTIKNVYNTYVEYKNKVDIFHVSYSGGKDSEVTLDIIQRSLPHNAFVVIFGDTGMEFPDTYMSVELMKKKCEKENIKFYIAHSRFSPSESWRHFGPPSSTIRWCCSVHKTAPQLLLIRKILGKTHFTEMAFVGVRADESIRRSGYSYISYGTKHKGQFSCNPILSWNSAEIFLYIFQFGLHLNEAYKRGNSRAGCLVCPMSTNKNDFLNHICYEKSTKPLLNIIREVNGTYKNDEVQMDSYIENNGWKARKNGRDLSISPKDYDESFVGNNLVITFKDNNNNWKQWLKTIGEIILGDNTNNVLIEMYHHTYTIEVLPLKNGYYRISTENDKSAEYADFLKKIRIICRKTHYCVGCEVCTANCKYGNIKFYNNNVTISDRCIKCGQCLDIDTGCYVYKSLWLSKGLGNMNSKTYKSIDCYAAHGPKIEWFQQYVKFDKEFKFKNTLGNNQIPAFNRFLRDSGLVENESDTKLGLLFKKSNMEDENIWALLFVNLAYTPQVGWYVHNFNMFDVFSQRSVVNLLSTTEGVSASAQKSIPASLRRISALPINNVGFGFSEKSKKEDGGVRFCRKPWLNPNPLVVLYSLYKYAEACGGYYQFSMSQLYNKNIDSDGISPYRLFGIEEDELKKILIGLSTNYESYINVSFTHNLDNINLREDKRAEDVLDLFN